MTPCPFLLDIITASDTHVAHLANFFFVYLIYFVFLQCQFIFIYITAIFKIMETQQVICDNPRIVFNPSAPELIMRHRVFYMHGQRRYWRGNSKPYLERSFGRLFSLKYNGINKDNYNDCYILSKDGEMFPLYIAVPCGHCPNCELSRQFSFVQRCKLETLQYDNKPWFVTLTYRNSCLPKDGQLSVRDVQLFLKRFRQRLKRDYDGKYDFPLRYAVCGEYGKKQRPHYHVIFWNLHSYSHSDYVRIKDIINKSWSNGFIMSRVIDAADSERSFKYTTKYLCKDSTSQHLPFDGAKPPFLNSSRSRGVGGIGKLYLIEHFASHMQKTLDVNPLFYNRWSGSVERLTVNTWVLNNVFPSRSRLFPSFVRRALVELSYFAPDDSYLCLFRRYVFIPDFNDIESNFCVDTSLFNYHDADECRLVISKWLVSLEHRGVSLESFLDSLESSTKKRECFLFALFSGASPVDLKKRSYLARRMSERSKSLEVL